MRFMLASAHPFVTYACNLICVSLISFFLMNPAGSFIDYFLTFDRRDTWGEFTISGIQYYTAMTAVSLIVQAGAVVISTISARSIIQNINPYAAAVFLLIAWLFSNFSQAENYGLDIYFTNPLISTFAIAMAPLLAFSLITSLFLRRSLIPLPENGLLRFMLLIACTTYIIVIFTIFAMIVLQPDWSEWFRFYSKFDNQGRGG